MPEPLSEVVRTSELRELRRAQRVLERELSGLLLPQQVDALLNAAVVEAADAEDPAARLRALVGARLLDAVGDLLGRVADEVPSALDAAERRALRRAADDASRAPRLHLAASFGSPASGSPAVDERRGRARVARAWTASRALGTRLG